MALLFNVKYFLFNILKTKGSLAFRAGRVKNLTLMDFVESKN